MKLKPVKNSGLIGIQTLYLCDTGTVLYQLSYEANWALVGHLFGHEYTIINRFPLLEITVMSS